MKKTKEELIKELKEKNIEFSKEDSIEDLENLIFINDFNANEIRTKKKEKTSNNKNNNKLKEYSDVKKAYENDYSFIKTKKYLSIIEKIIYGSLIILFVLIQIISIVDFTTLNEFSSHFSQIISIILSDIIETFTIAFLAFVTFVSIKMSSFFMDYIYINRKDKNNDKDKEVKE